MVRELSRGLFLLTVVTVIGRCVASWMIFYQEWTSGLFLESPWNFSGSKSQLLNCNPLVLKS